MKRIPAIILAASITAFTGCVSATYVDTSNGDIVTYSHPAWRDSRVEEAAARMRHWVDVARTRYPANTPIRLEMTLFVNETNVIRRAEYQFGK